MGNCCSGVALTIEEEESNRRKAIQEEEGIVWQQNFWEIYLQRTILRNEGEGRRDIKTKESTHINYIERDRDRDRDRGI